MQLIRMVSTVVLHPARLGMGFAIGPSRGHPVSLVQLVQQDVAALSFDDRIIDPDLAVGHELIYLVVPSFGEVDVESAPDQPAVHDPDDDGALQLFPQLLVHGFDRREGWCRSAWIS